MSWASHPVHGSVVFHDRRWVDRTLCFIICFRTSVWMGTSLRSSRVWMTFISGRTYFLLLTYSSTPILLNVKCWSIENKEIILLIINYYSITKETTINPISHLLDNRSFVWHDWWCHCQKHSAHNGGAPPRLGPLGPNYRGQKRAHQTRVCEAGAPWAPRLGFFAPTPTPRIQTTTCVTVFAWCNFGSINSAVNFATPSLKN